MMMATRNDIKDRLIHNQSPYPTKDKVLSYTIPVDHSESLLFCSSGASTSSSSQDNGSLSFITSEDDPCNGRDSLASFLDEGLGTSLDGVDEISSPIFPTLGRNDSGIFSSDEGGAAGGVVGTGSTHNHNNPSHASLIPPPISSSTSTCSTISSGCSGGGSNIISVAEVVSWKGCQSGASANNSGILLSPAATTTTISVVTDSATGIPSIICSSTPSNNPGGTSVPTVKLETRQLNNTGGGGQATGKGTQQQLPPQQQRCKSMPLGRQGPQKCTICDKVFSNASALTKHKLTHSDERRHACATCGKAFKRQDHLNGHMLTHRNKKPFECKSKGCGKSYCDARSLRRHVENRHGHDVLESMNLTSHHHSKHSNKNNNHNNTNNNHNQQHHEPPQPELAPTVTFTPIVKFEPQQQPERISKSKILDCMPVLQPEQPQLEASSVEKATAQPPILQKCGESNTIPNGAQIIPNIQIQTSSSAGAGSTATTLPIVLKRENVSVFDFDENIEDNPQVGVTFPHQEKLLSSLSNATIKVSNVIDSSKLGQLPDIRLIQEWTKRLGDSKVALFLASSSAASSLTQFAGPMASIQLADGQTASMPPGSATFIPTTENGLFSVTPISLVPTSSGEYTFKPATISVPNNTDSPKSLYIVPSEPILSTLPPPPPIISVTASVAQQLPPPPPPIITSSSVNITNVVNSTSCPTSTAAPKHDHPKKEKVSKHEKAKSAIGQSLANRIKTKLKAGSLKKLGKSSGHDISKQTSSIVISKPAEDNGPRLALQHPLPISGTAGIPTISITAGGISATTTWCESPKECHSGNGVAMEEDRLSEGAEGEDKPVECSICCRRFKNTPALNGHMRLHGGYFKKETEGSKKKDQVSKEPTHSTPLQTASVSVRALIEEKIKERRNNLLKLAAATAEKAANEGAAMSSEGSNNNHPPAPVQTSKSKSSDKASTSSLLLAAAATPGDPSPEVKSLAQQPPPPISAPTIIAQQSKLLLGETLKLKIEPNTTLMEKDRNCDQDTNNFSRNINLNGNNNSNCSNNNISNSNNNSNSSSSGAAPPPTMVIDPSFHELDILIGDSSNMVGERLMNGSHNHHDLLTPQLLQSNNTSGGGFPLMDKSNFTFLDCDLNADDLCQAFHLIYVDNNNGADLPLTMDQETLGKVSKMFQDPIPELSSLGMSLNDNQSMMKQEVVEPVVCLPNDDPCNLPWEWRNSTSSDNTENSFGNVQDCVNSLLCSSSSDTPDESSTKDPVAGGGYCYTPILSPNSTFCLTPGPDSPFETTSHSLSFISPSPTMGNGSGFSDPSSSLGNPSTSVESLFSSDQPSLQTVSMSMSTTTTPSSTGPTEDDSVLQKYSQQLNGQQMDAPMYISSFSDLNLTHCEKQGILSISQFAPQQLQLPQQITTVHTNNGTPLECLPPINIFSKITPNNSNCNDLYKLGSNFSIFDGKEPIFHIPVSNNSMQQQNSFIPSYELFAPLPLPKKVSEKWMSGKAEKNKKINIGSEYQAEIPSFRGNKGRHKACRSLDEKLWDPNILDTCSFVEVDKYLEFACCSAVPGGGTNKEYALHLLTLSRGNIREALLRLMEKVPSLPAKLRSYSYLENQRWSSEEIMAFQISLVQTGKDFTRISKAIGSKSQGECICFYYFWKKACVNEYQAMKQIWRDRITLQQSQKSQINIVNSNNQNHVSFLLSPSQQIRSICK